MARPIPALPLGRDLRDPQADADAMSAWQPIETAPKDGTWILGFGRHSRGGCNQLTIVWLGEWISGDDGYRPYITPTHWQPLPEPPESAP